MRTHDFTVPISRESRIISPGDVYLNTSAESPLCYVDFHRLEDQEVAMLSSYDSVYHCMTTRLHTVCKSKIILTQSDKVAISFNFFELKSGHSCQHLEF